MVTSYAREFCCRLKCGVGCLLLLTNGNDVTMYRFTMLSIRHLQAGSGR